MPSITTLTTPPVPCRALIVEDNAAISAMVMAQLAQAGWDVVFATTMREGLIALEDRTRVLDMCFLDLRLPDGNGMDLIGAAQSRRDQPDIVVMTGFASEDAMLNALRLGVLDFLKKPFNTTDIANVLRRRAVRERMRLGIMAERFERVDADFIDVRKEIHAIREQLNLWEASSIITRARKG